jgi:DNA-binding response OmpR family regulator
MLSGRESLFDRDRGRLLGSEGFLAKPFEAAELVEMVGRYAR